MHRTTTLLCAALGGAAVAAMTASAALAAWEPKKPITIVVGYAAGGGTDIPARALASVAQEFVPVPLVVVNRTGASGTIAAEYVAKAPADGYTLLVAGGSESTSVGNHQKLNYDPRNDFTGIIQITRQRTFVAVKGDSKWTSLKAFVDDAKANPGKYQYGSSGAGSIYHSAMLVFMKATGTDMRHVPFRGGAPSLAALVGGHIDVSPLSPDEGKAMLDAGNVRALATFSDARFEGYPDVPTMKELGYDVYLENMKGIVGPKGLPDEVRDYLHAKFKQATDSDAFKALAKRTGMELQYRDGAGFQKAIADMYNLIGGAVR